MKQDDMQSLKATLDFPDEIHREASPKLGAQQYDAFVAALKAPTKSRPRLEKLLKIPTVFDLDSGPMSDVDEVVNGSDERIDYDAELRASIERGLADCEAGRLVPVEDLMKEFGIED